MIDTQYECTSTCGIVPPMLPHLKAGLHFEVVSEAAWKLLHGWYKGTPIPRYKVRNGLLDQAEIYPALVMAWCKGKGDLACFVSKYGTVGELKQMICDRFSGDEFVKLNPSKCRLWDTLDGVPVEELLQGKVGIMRYARTE